MKWIEIVPLANLSGMASHNLQTLLERVPSISLQLPKKNEKAQVAQSGAQPKHSVGKGKPDVMEIDNDRAEEGKTSNYRLHKSTLMP